MQHSNLFSGIVYAAMRAHQYRYSVNVGIYRYVTISQALVSSQHTPILPSSEVSPGPVSRPYRKPQERWKIAGLYKSIIYFSNFRYFALIRCQGYIGENEANGLNSNICTVPTWVFFCNPCLYPYQRKIHILIRFLPRIRGQPNAVKDVLTILSPF